MEELGYKFHEIDETDIYQLTRMMMKGKQNNSKVTKVKSNESLIGAITGRDPRE
ncbi:hypothetical protein [Staphylococcus saprophyticus]|uniref:hypothetical protein n=1 Tax=Staphylococcus saprophyticus TaxID=29385 RepID=UPI0034DD2319